MSTFRLFRCRQCGLPHEVGTAVCPLTGKEIVHRSQTVAAIAEKARETGQMGLVEPSSEGGPAAGSPPPQRSAPPPPLPKRAPLPNAPPLLPSAPVAPTRTSPGEALHGRPNTAPSPGAPQVPAARRTTARIDGEELVGIILGERYLVQDVLAVGGMGVVYKAVHLGLKRPVAIKALSQRVASNPTAVARFQNEARLSALLGHPNIVEVYDAGTLPDGMPFLVMERLTGEALSDRLKRLGALPIDEVVAITQQILSALAATHAQQIVHRDLKPANVFLVERQGLPPVVKLLDFGIAKPLAGSPADGAHTSLTLVGFVPGTPAYMAPEQARGDRTIDARADLYATGVLTYQMLLNRLPYAARLPAQLLAEMQQRPVLAPHKARPETPPWLEAVILKLLTLDRGARFQTAASALEALNRHVINTDVELEGEPTVIAPSPFLREFAALAASQPTPDADSSQKIQVLSRESIERLRKR